jgi:uroporphyrinogen III methyltransferase/synthase
MGVKNLAEICRKLIFHGRPAETPVAVIRWGTTPRQQTVAGTLESIADRVRQAGLKPPAIIVVGEVVGLRDTLNWFESRPLFGRSIIVTRAREQASDFKEILQRLGAHCIEFPTIGIEPPPSWEPMDAAISRLSSYHWIIFTSVNGVEFFLQRLFATGCDVRELKGLRLCAIGPKTAEVLDRHGLRLDLIPEEYRAESILDGLSGEPVTGLRFLMPRALAARDILPETLRRRGAQVDVVAAYQTVLPDSRTASVFQALTQGQVDCLTFTSSSTVSNFFGMFERDAIMPVLKGVAIACIGPVTGQTAEKYGLTVDIMPSTYTIPAMVEAIQDYFAAMQPRAHGDRREQPA